MGGMHGNKRDGTLAGLCLVIGVGSCKWQLTALVKAVAEDCCSVQAFVHSITYKHQKFLFVFIILYLLLKGSIVCVLLQEQIP